MSEPPPPPPATAALAPPRVDRAFWLATLIASLALVAALWVVPYLPTNDGPEHVLLGRIENHFDDPGAIYAQYLRPAPQFAGRGFAALFVPLEALLPWRTALRATLALGLLAWAWGFVALVRALAPARRWASLLGFAFAFQWALYLGFFPFVFGSALGFWVIALALAPGVRPRVRAWGTAALLLAQAVMHAFTGLLTLAVLGALALIAPPPAANRARVRALGRLALEALPALAIVALTLGERPAVRATPFAHGTDWLPLADWVRFFPRYFQTGALWRGLAALALASAGVAATFARHRRRDATLAPAERALAVAAAGLLAAGALAPWNIPGWQMFAPRFVPLGAMLGVALVPLERARGALAAGLVAAFALIALGHSAHFHRTLAAACADALALLDAPTPRAGLVLPVPASIYCREGNAWITTAVPGMAPCLHLGSLYAAAHGGLPRYMFSSSAAGHSFTLRAALPPAPPVERLAALVGAVSTDARDARRATLLDEFALAGARYDAVVALAPPRDLARFARRGYRTEFARGEAYVGRFTGCPAAVVLPVSERESPTIEFGWYPLRAAAWRGAVDAATARDADGRARVALPGAPCGPLWVRVVWDRDRSGAPSSGDAACRGADARGLVVREGRAEGVEIECVPETVR